jgi:hypothetical protein
VLVSPSPFVSRSTSESESESELDSNKMSIGSPSSEIFDDALDGTDGIERILMGLAMELVVELVDFSEYAAY